MVKELLRLSPKEQAEVAGFIRRLSETNQPSEKFAQPVNETPKNTYWSQFGAQGRTVLLAVLSAVLTGYVSYQYGLNTQIKVNNTQKRQQAYSELMGRKAVLKQLYVSRFEALIFSDYHEARWRMSGKPKESLHLQEAQRWMHKSEDFALDVAKSNQSLFETLGLIRAVFPSSTKQNDLIEKLYHFKSPKILGAPFEMNIDQLEYWKAKAVKDLQELVDREYGAPIEELVAILSTEVNK